jgi:hypothetical protein
LLGWRSQPREVTVFVRAVELLHWLRHTTLTWVERNFNYGIARAFAGHNGRSDATATSTYIRADLYAVSQALAALCGEAHPLAERTP